MKDPIIELRDLSKRYGQVSAVEGLNLDIQQGEIFGLLGPNGAGKTTTILMLLGLTEPTGGSATVCGHNATSSPMQVKRKVGYMPDNVGFYGNLTALENLLYIGRLNGIPETELQGRSAKVLDTVGLSADKHKKTSAFSRGMKQRLGLAEVLIKAPEVIILDEPTLGIDPTGVREFLALIRQLSRQQGLTVLLSSHHLHHVQQVCDRVGIFVKGKLLAQGPIGELSAQLFGNSDQVTTVSFAAPLSRPWLPAAELERWPSVSRLMVRDDELELTSTRDLTAALVRFLVEKGCEVNGVHRKHHGLDEIYQQYFEGNSTTNTNYEKSIS